MLKMTQDPHRDDRFGLLDLLRLLLLVGLAALVLPGIAGGPRPAAAQERAVEWARFDVTLDLREDGSIHVAEQQQIDFQGGPFSGGFANIPLARIDDIGNVRLSAVTDTGTEPYTYVPPSEYEEEPGTYTYRVTNADLEVQWGFPPARNESRTFLLEYDVAGVLRSYFDQEPPYQQISWIAVGEEVTEIAPVREARVTLRLPAAVDPAQTEISPADEPAEHTIDGQVWTWQTSDLTSGEAFEIGLRFPPLVNAPPPSWQEASDEQEAREAATEERSAVLNLIFLGLGGLLAVGGGLGAYGLWYARGRDPHTGPVADFLPQPPDDLPPGAAGTLLDERADEQDIIATLVDLGHRGVLKIEETEGEGFLGIGAGHDFQLTLQQDAPKVAPFEEDFLHALFGHQLKAGMTTKLSDVKERVTAAQGAIREELYEELVRRGYFLRSPEATRASWRNFGTVAIVVAVVAGCVGAGAVAEIAPLVWVPVAVVVGLGLLLLLISNSLPRKTAVGAEAAARWRAFRKYLESIEKYEQLDEAKGIFDRYLPYAVAFGLERSWVQKFASVQVSTPDWFGGGTVAVPGGFGGYGGWSGGWGEPYGRPMRGRRGFGGGTVIFPGGGWGGGGGWDGERRGGDGDGGFDGFDVPDLQETSDRAGRGLQGTSDSLFDMLNSAGRAFGGFSGGGRRGGDWGGGGGFGGGGGGFSGGSGGGGRGFR